MLTLANRDLSFPAAAGSHVSPEKRHQGARVVTKPAWKPSVRASGSFLLRPADLCSFWTLAYQWKMSLFWLLAEYLVWLINSHEL